MKRGGENKTICNSATSRNCYLVIIRPHCVIGHKRPSQSLSTANDLVRRLPDFTLGQVYGLEFFFR